MKNIIFLVIISVFLYSCTTTYGVRHHSIYKKIESPEDESIGFVETEKRFWLLYPSPEHKREELNAILLEKAKNSFGETAEIRTIYYSSNANPLFMLEKASAQADVYDPQIRLAKERAEQEYFEQCISNAKEVDSDLIITSITTSEPDENDGICVSVDLLNIGEKTLKYVILDVIPINRVNDPVGDNYSDDPFRQLKITGPVEKWEPMSFYSKPLWFNHTIARADIYMIEVIYMDNSNFIIDDPKQIKDFLVLSPSNLNEE